MTIPMFESVGAPVLQVGGDGEALTGFLHFWWRYVRGFNPKRHCMVSLVGNRGRGVLPGMKFGRYTMDQHHPPFFYLCGVASRGGWTNNFHLAMRPLAGGTVIAETYNRVVVTVSNVERLDIPPLEPGFRGLPKSFTTCRNFQFGVAYLEPK